MSSALTLVAVTAGDIFNEVVAADLAWPLAPTGANVERLDLTAYYRLKKSADSRLRNEAAQRFLGHLGAYRELFSVMLLRRIEGDAVVARQRNLRDAADTLLVLNDGLEPRSYRAMFAASRHSKAEVARAARVLARVHGMERVSGTDLFVPMPSPAAHVSVSDAIDTVLIASAALGDDYQALLRQRFTEGWLHLPPSAQKSGTVGVFWQVGGGHPHAVMSYNGDYASARMLGGAAILMMGYASVPVATPPDRREEDLPVFSNSLWLLGPLMVDRVTLQRDLAPAERVQILSAQLTWLLQSFLRNALVAELEATLGDRLAAGTAVSGADISKLYLDLLHELLGESVAIEDYLGNEWMTHRTLFYGPHYASFAAATAVAVVLDDAIAEGDRKAIAAVRDGIGRSRTHLSGEVLEDAGIDLSNSSSYAAVTTRIGRLADELTQVLDRIEAGVSRSRTPAGSSPVTRKESARHNQ